MVNISDFGRVAQSFANNVTGAITSALNSSGLDRLMSSPSTLARFGPGNAASYTVQRGDTLTSIARQHGTSWQTLARINGLSNPDLIMPGQQIRLPAGTATTYTVAAGDTLSAIAAANGTSIANIARTNGISNPNRIYPGQVLTIPSSDTGLQTTAFDPVTTNSAAPDTAAARLPEGQVNHRLGSLSEQYESGNRGPGTVSGGINDAGGVSYGVYQLSSNAGTAAAFMRNEGARWASEFGSSRPGSEAFTQTWRTIAAREPEAFRSAQHGFIQRTHYQPAVDAVSDRTGLNLDGRHNAVRDAAWSVSVQHGRAATILNRAVAATDAQLSRNDAGYDRALVANIYSARTSYVLNVANTSTRLNAGERAQLVEITRTRYPAELRDALRMIDTPQTTPQPNAASPIRQDGIIDGNIVARQNGVNVKSARVAITRLDANMEPVIVAVATAARNLGLPTPVITSGNDSRHGSNSLHYENRALDFRGNNITAAQGQRFEQEVDRLLGPGYDVIFETFADASNNHLHVEYDPR